MLKVAGLLAVVTLAAWASAEELLKPVGGSGSGPTVDGLQTTIRPVKEDFGPGESILIHWRLSNKEQTPKVVKLNREPRTPCVFTFEIQRDGKPVPSTMAALGMALVEKALRGESQLDSWIDLRAVPWADPKWLDQRGQYEILVNYLGAPGGKALPSGKATFRIVAAGTPSFPRLDPKLAEQIKTLIAQLGADDFAVREEAQKKLFEVGEKAIGPLTEALTNAEDPEIRLRCQNLIDQIRQARAQVPPNEVLCDRCRGLAFTGDIGQCRQCQGHTPSGGWIYCQACAHRLNRCAACGQILRIPLPVPQPVPQPQPRPRPVPPPVPQPVPPPAPNPQPVPPPRPPPDDF